MNPSKKYLSIDLEMNQPSRKIIQVGIAIGSYDDYQNEEIQTCKWYLDPEEPISEFITELTGITDSDIKEMSISYETLAERLSYFINTEDVFVNPITWGGGDSSELLQEFTKRNIEFKHFGHRWIDVKTYYVFDRIAKNKSTKGGLSSAMEALSNNKLHFKGKAHRADVDAFNTLRLFFHCMNKNIATDNIIQTVRNHL